MDGYGLSPRGAANVAAIWPKISNAATEREKKNNPVIDLGTSENCLMRAEIAEVYKNAIQSNLSDRHFSYPNGFAGDLDLLDALVTFFNKHFNPLIPVEREHLAIAPGAASSLDALLYNICEPGDGLLIPTPCWNGFDWLVGVRSGVVPVFASVETFDDVFTSKAISSLEDAFSESQHPIKGLLFTNPNNPFGQCYPSELIKEMIRFCDQKNIHFISDEIYAMSGFENPDVPEPTPFVPLLQLDIRAMGCDLSRVHTLWSISKDFGSNGMRMGCCITQGNKPLATGVTLASHTTLSSLTAIAATSILTSPELPELLKINAERLTQAYTTMTQVLKELRIPYMPANMGPFLFARLAPYAKTWQDESRVMEACKAAGVSVSTGKSYHGPDAEKGWARLNFAIQPAKLEEALGRLRIGLKSSSEVTENGATDNPT